MSMAIEAVRWIHGAEDCAASQDPPLQVHRFDADTFVLRQSKCFSSEGPFMYLLFGAEKAVLFDTGARADAEPGPVLPLRRTVEDIVERRLAERGQAQIDLIVAHTHAHGDHASWDRQFLGRPRTTVVEPDLAAVKGFFGFPAWPDGRAVLDLGGRELLVLPVPGHEGAHVAVYDRNTRILLTGDTLYPGLLVVNDWPAYRRSAARLARLLAEHPVALVLGAHIEMKNRPGEFYPVGTTFQPDEHPLPLGAEHVRELHEACEAMGDQPRRDVHADFIIVPRVA